MIPSLKNHGNFKVCNLMTPCTFFILKVQVHVEDNPARIFKATEVGTNITFVSNVIFVLELTILVRYIHTSYLYFKIEVPQYCNMPTGSYAGWVMFLRKEIQLKVIRDLKN